MVLKRQCKPGLGGSRLRVAKLGVTVGTFCFICWHSKGLERAAKGARARPGEGAGRYTMHMVQTVKEGQTAQDEGVTLALVACKHTIYRGARARPLRPWLMGLQVRQRPAAGMNASTRAVACIAQGARAAGVCVPWFVQTNGSRGAEQVDVKGSMHAASCTGSSCCANPVCVCTSSAAAPAAPPSSRRSALRCRCCPPLRTRSRAAPQCQRRSVPAAQAAAPASVPPEGPAPRRPAGEWKVQQ